VRIMKAIVSKVAAIVIVGVLFVGPANLQSCNYCDFSEEMCCCCENFCQSSQHNDRDKKECSCEISEGTKAESPSAVIVTHPDNKPKMDSGSVEVEIIDKFCFTQLSDSNPYTSAFLSRDPPLYLLNSSFLI